MAFEYFKAFLIVIFLTWTSRATYGLSEETKTAIQSGLEAGTALADVLKDGKFRQSLVKLGKNLAPFLSALGPLAGFAFAFIPQGDSEELKFMKEKFAEVNNKLDIITSEFIEVKNAIEWSSLKNSYGDYERKIRAAEYDLNKLYASHPDHTNGPKEEFLNSYDDFDNSLQQLYAGIMEDDYTFSSNILDAVIQKTKYHKRKFEKFSLGLVQLLVQGIKVKISAYAIKGYSTHTVDKLQQLWTKNMRALGQRLEKKSDEIKGRYITQLRIDAEDTIRRHHSLGNKGLLLKIYKFVEDKYDWRYWFVAVYDDITGHDKHAISACGGAILLHKDGKKNVIISSQDKKYASRFSESDAKKMLKDVENDIDTCKLPNPDERAKALRGNARKKTGNGCVPYALVMVVTTGEGLTFINWGNESHRAYRKIKKTKSCNCNFWGCHRTYWHHYVIVFG